MTMTDEEWYSEVTREMRNKNGHLRMDVDDIWYVWGYMNTYFGRSFGRPCERHQLDLFEQGRIDGKGDKDGD